MDVLMWTFRILLFFLVALPVWTATWHVDKAATGANSGTSPSDAWTTWAVINWPSVISGDTILVQGGSYNEFFDITNKSNLSVKIHPSSTQKAIFKGAHIFNMDNGLIDGYLNGAQYFHFSGNASFGFGAFIIRNSSNLTVRGIEAEREAIHESDTTPYHVTAINTCDHITVEYCYFHHSSADGLNIIAAALDDDVYDNFIIRNNRIFYVADDGIQLGSNKAITVQNNYVDNGNAPARFGGHPDGVQMNPGGGNLLISGNTFRGFNQNIFIEGSTKNIFIYNNSLIGIRTSGTDSGVTIGHQTPFVGICLIANNMFYNFNSFGAINASQSLAAAGGVTLISNNIMLDCKVIISSENTSLLDPSNIYFNSPGVQFYSSGGAPVTVFNQYAGDSRFVDPKIANPPAYDFRISINTSPAVGTGTNFSPYFATDQAGLIRSASEAWDVGAYGWIPASIVPAARRPGHRGAGVGMGVGS